MFEIKGKGRHLAQFGAPLIEDASACVWHRLELVDNPDDDFTPTVAVELEVHGERCRAFLCVFGRRAREIHPWGEA